MGNTVTIQCLELEEIEAWQIYQAHAKETERLRRAWIELYSKLATARVERSEMNKVTS